MSSIVYKKIKTRNPKNLFRITALGIAFGGMCLLFYISFPLVSWQLYFAPIVASANVAAPIPRATVVNPGAIKSLIVQAGNNFSGIDYNNATNWFPTYKAEKTNDPVSSYLLSIPSLNITDAQVSTTDYNLDKHLVHYNGTALPPTKGNAVIFGHSTLPQLFDPKDYKTIFANVYKLVVGDIIYAMINGVTYTYKIFT